jgi:hypothetical protein
MTMIDISKYIVGVDWASEPDYTAIHIPGLRETSVTFSGIWKPTDDFADLVVRASGHLPRKSKKALRKYWMGQALGPREHQRMRRCIGR